MAGLCEGCNEPPGSLKAKKPAMDRQGIKSEENVSSTNNPGAFSCRIKVNHLLQSLMLAGSEFQSLGRAIVKEDEYEEVRWDGIVSIVS
ncbi:hypothetical protein ANN_20380 [Periplaneta americana]|uniref:Uncharacterized protein n=1 Tax=Periplaneta americana TaxID=6978 RepID=A0ABQ8SDK7_PERAM|nr:hypothetical protein ANN_20380 [Periplaneta americana]